MTKPPEAGRRLAALWFADIVGYTTLSSQDEDGALEVVGTFQRLAEEIVQEHSGRVVKFIGDAALAEFASTDGAIRSALTLLERYLEAEPVRRYGSTLRVGVNVGEIITSPDGDIYGDGVNLASRLQNQASPGQVVASESVHAQIRQRPVFRTEPLGQRAVKGIADPVRLYSVTLQEAGEDGTFVTSVEATPPPTPPKRPRRGRWLGVALTGVAAATAVLLLNPGGVTDRLLPGQGVTVTQTTYPVVEGGMDIGASVVISFDGMVDQTAATSRNVQLLDAEGRPVPAEVSVGADQRTVVVDPSVSLAYATIYTLSLGETFTDPQGASVRGPDGGRPVFSIRTQPVPADALPAQARLAADLDASAAPVDQPLVLRFSEALDPRSMDSAAIRLVDEAGRDVEAGVTLGSDDVEVTIAPAEPLSPGGRYVVHVGADLSTRTGLGVAADSLPLQAASPTARATSGNDAPARSGPTPPAPRTGPATLNLTVAPAAARPFLKVVVDGDTVGPPPVRALTLAEGRAHVITIVGVPDLSAYTTEVYRREVTPDPGQVLNVAAQIQPFGSIDVVSEPAGTVFVDGRQVGRTPLAGFPVTAGVVHRLEIRPTAADADRVDPFTAEFRVEPLEWKSLGRMVLPPKG